MTFFSPLSDISGGIRPARAAKPLDPARIPVSISSVADSAQSQIGVAYFRVADYSITTGIVDLPPVPHIVNPSTSRAGEVRKSSKYISLLGSSMEELEDDIWAGEPEAH